jgi:hypothetical protein
MTTSMLDAQWTADPTQPGRIAAGEAIQIDVTVAYTRVPGDEVGPGRLSKAMRLVKETEALVLAAPAMAKALLVVWEHDRRFRESPEDAARSPIEQVAAALALAEVPLP